MGRQIREMGEITGRDTVVGILRMERKRRDLIHTQEGHTG